MPRESIAFFLAGAAMGLSAGFSPGPLFTLVLSQTLAHGPREGIKVAVAPLLTDLPIVIASLVLLARLEGQPVLMGLVTLAGAVVLVGHGRDCLLARAPATGGPLPAPRSLRKGVMVNFLNPSPYLFWMTVGAPTVLAAAGHGRLAVAGYLGSFYGAMVGAKILAALVTGRFRAFVRGRAYRVLMAGLGLSLIFFAAVFLRQGLLLLAGAP